MEIRDIDSNGLKASVRIKGEGADVVLLHGFGEDGSVWTNQYDALSGFRLIIPDLPGSGKTAPIADMSMEGLATWLNGVLEVMNVSRLTLIGHSMGGYISLAYAERYPQRLRGLGLFHSSSFADSPEKKETRQKGIRFIEENGAYPFLKTLIPNLFSAETKEKNPQIIEEQINAANNFSGAALVSYYMSMMNRPDRTHILKNAQVPILIILGNFDTAVPLEDGLRLCYSAPLSYIHILESSGHMGMKEEPLFSNTILMNYLKSLDHHSAQ